MVRGGKTFIIACVGSEIIDKNFVHIMCCKSLSVFIILLLHHFFVVCVTANDDNNRVPTIVDEYISSRRDLKKKNNGGKPRGKTSKNDKRGKKSSKAKSKKAAKNNMFHKDDTPQPNNTPSPPPPPSSSSGDEIIMCDIEDFISVTTYEQRSGCDFTFKTIIGCNADRTLCTYEEESVGETEGKKKSAHDTCTPFNPNKSGMLT